MGSNENDFEKSFHVFFDAEPVPDTTLEEIYEPGDPTPTYILRPCPFCGGEPHVQHMGWPHHVYCGECGARITGSGHGRAGERDAVHKWNTRIGKHEQIGFTTYKSKGDRRLED